MTDWPELRVEAWADTRDTLHMWSQIVGKVSLALAPMINHWWGVTFRVDPTGMSTPLLPYGDGGVQLGFDLTDHVLRITTTRGHREMKLAPRSVADFYGEFRTKLRELDIDVKIFPRPVEIAEAIPFAEDTQHASYDADAVERFHRVLVSSVNAFSEFRSEFIGKVSPVQFFWGGFDLAVTRFSGRAAPQHRGGVPNCPDYVQYLAYSHEVSSAGYWPGGDGEGVFYSYAYPEPPGFADAAATGRYDAGLGEFVLPVTDVRTAEDPDATLMSFLRSTYEAAAGLAAWDRPALERTT